VSWRWLLVLYGCGPGSFGEFRDQLAAHVCDHARRCGAIGLDDPCPYPSALPTAGSLDVPTGIADGRLGYDRDSAQACLDAFNGAPCDPAILALRLYEHCHHVVGPHVVTGEICRVSDECVGGTCQCAGACDCRCVAWPPPHSACQPGGCDPTFEFCDGSCELQMGQDGACVADEQCQFPLVCRGDKCQHHPRVADGSPCNFPDAVCDDQRYCSPSSGACTPLRAPGAACDARSACSAGNGCADGLCRPWSDEGRPCSDGLCPLSQRCLANSDGGADGGLSATCVADPTLPAGPHESCQSRSCAGGLYCTRDRSCEYLRGLGGECDPEDSGCAPGLTCSNGRCQASTSCAVDGGAD
jgi:hypothetical protein